MHIYIYTHTYIYIHTYIHTHTCTHVATHPWQLVRRKQACVILHIHLIHAYLDMSTAHRCMCVCTHICICTLFACAQVTVRPMRTQTTLFAYVVTIRSEHISTVRVHAYTHIHMCMRAVEFRGFCFDVNPQAYIWHACIYTHTHGIACIYIRSGQTCHELATHLFSSNLYVRQYLGMRMYICMCISVYVCMHACICISMYVCIYIPTSVHIALTCIHKPCFGFSGLFIYVICIYIYVYIYIYIYIYVCFVHTCTHLST
jgi:hypothetical protein